MPRLSIIFLSLLCFSCSKQDDAPQQFSSFDYRMDGSRFVADIGVPEEVSTLSVCDTNHPILAAPSAIVPLSNATKFTYALAEGSSIRIGNETTSQIIAAMPEEKRFVQILTDQAAIYGIHADGNINAFDHSGKSLWKREGQGFMRGVSILAENKLVIPTDSGICGVDIHSGKNIWFYPIATPGKSSIYDAKSKLIITAISFNNSDASDSILCFSPVGALKSRCGFAMKRIISNLCLCGKEKDKIAFGYIGKQKEVDAMRSLKVAIYSGVQVGNPKNISDHEVPYLATNIASNGPIVLASGFEQVGGSLESGIDAFYADDTIKLWQRRFTQPLVTPVMISNKFAYFSLTFATDAEVPAKSIFYTLDLSTGKTLGELPITGVKNGSVTGMPTPLGEREFVLYDASHPALYFLKP